MRKIYTPEELHEEVIKENKPFRGIPNLIHNKTSANRPSDWWKKEDTPEATEEHTKRCYASLEQQRKLKMPDHTHGDEKHGEMRDYEEYADR